MASTATHPGVQPSPSGSAGVTALLFDRDRVEEITTWEEGLPRLRRSSILWIDLEAPKDEHVRRLVEELDLGDEIAEALLGDGAPTAQFVDYGTHLHVVACAPSDGDARALRRINCLVSERWIVTAHEAPVEVIEIVRERAAGSGRTGDLDGPEFLADILEWVVQSYLGAFEEIERSLEEIDAVAMNGGASPDATAIARLVECRREIGSLRRALTSHRAVVLTLMRPELEAIASSASAERFAALHERLELAAQAARDSREAVVGSFDVLLASTGQRTNEVMKILTLASVLLLPGSLIAGIFGMNFRLGFFQEAWHFWPVIGLMAVVAVATLVVARMRRWI